jgi:hypothetical protein
MRDSRRRMLPQRAKFVVMLLGLGFLVGCSSAGGNGNSTPAPTATLTASPASILAGQSSTLTITSTNAETGSIDNGVGQAGINDSLVVAPTITTKYTLTVTGPGGTATASTTVTVSAINSFDGIVYGSGPETATQDVDPNGAVGTKQYMEYVNTEFQAFEKTSPYTPVWSAPQQIGTIFKNPLNQPDIANCDGTVIPPSTVPSGIHVDGIINFDRLAKRWVVLGKSDFSNQYYLCLAVSNTDDLSDKNLGWYAYEIPLDFVGINLEGYKYFPDWPKLGTWSDGYYVTMDLEDVSNGYAEIGAAICVFDRNDILAQTSATPPPVLIPVCRDFPTTLDPVSQTYLGHSLIPADVDGTTAPPAGRPEFIVSIENPSVAQNATTSSLLNLWQAQISWSGTPGLTLTQTTPAVTAFTPGCYLFDPQDPNLTLTNCVLEPAQGSGQQIDSVGDRLMPRFAYRNFGSHESFLVSHTVQTGPGSSGTTPSAYQTGIRWYEFRDSGSGTPAVYQQGTINPDAIFFRFLPSIDQDKDGNAAVGYSFSNAFTPPGIDFSFWNLGTGTATPAELTILDGPGEEVTPTTGAGAWGTYSSMTVDPVDDCTFWYVNEYWPTSAGWSTRIANFKLPTCN